MWVPWPAQFQMATSATAFPLCQLPAGAIGRVLALNGDMDLCQRIREIGFIERALVRKIGGVGPFVCQINDTRVALGHGAAASILVELLAAH
jgi:Fe2+ transport system protein FeoA